MKVLMCFPSDIFHILIVLSEDPDDKYSPFGEKATLKTGKEWPVSWTRKHIKQLSILNFIIIHFFFILSIFFNV